MEKVTQRSCRSLEMFKARLDGAWNSLGQWKVTLSMAGVSLKFLLLPRTRWFG